MKTYLKAVRNNRYYNNQDYLTLGKTYEAIKHFGDLYGVIDDKGDTILTNLGGGYHGFDFEEVKESEEMACKTWGEMTPEEKGTLLLAHHEGKVIEYKSVEYDDEWHESNPLWLEHLAYRVKPEGPKVEEKVFESVYVCNGEFPHTYTTNFTGTTKGSSTVTYTDGKPTKVVWECDSTAI